MLDLNRFYEKYNSPIEDKYLSSIDSIRKIVENTEEEGCYNKYFNVAGNFILKTAALEKEMNEKYFEEKTFEELKDINYKLYKELAPENYNRSYMNPAYAVEIFGDGIGQILSYFYGVVRRNVHYAFYHKRFNMYETNEAFISIYNYVTKNEVDKEQLRKLATIVETENLNRDEEIRTAEDMSAEFSFVGDICCEACCEDLRYLFRFGVYISENEIKSAQLLKKFSDEEVDSIAAAVVKAYLKGFATRNKAKTERNVSRIIHLVGLERITKAIINNLRNRGMDGVVASIISKNINEQVNFDHKFDKSLYIDEGYIGLKEEAYKKGLLNNKENIADKYLGNIIMVICGEENFQYEIKKENLQLSKEQSALMQKYNLSMKKIREKNIPGREVSYTGIAFPSAEIGENYETIFRDIIKINMVESDEVELIQQTLIGALDKGEAVHIKGTNGNETDITIYLNKLNNPEKESNFANCGADVNIPVGEVYTSPRLKGSNGLLHIEEIIVDGINYENLKLEFKDGYIDKYSCTNFEDEEKSMEFVKKNIILPHETLPIGELAIGTNTFAYVVTKKHGIVDKLHTLIVEKMGPHIAIGDTCFAWNEDNSLYNIYDGKEMIARDNERSILRKESVEKAYVNTHKDLTIPYDSLGEISVLLSEGGKIDIIRNGRFVLEGTEVLNKPFDYEISK
ncbi:MAG: aminopeptidase [Clostridium sp.]|uniref:aminopeptidase n=1 Tax=Clostridium sp. TaxID=1506 RepID=UPI0032177030|nr:aminopeptidase [Clostridium sp.]